MDQTAGSSRSPLLSATGLHLSYGRTPALRGASIEVAAGELVALVGPSGSGKSTLLLCLAGILVPDQGRLTFGGLDVTGMSDVQRTELRRRSFGFVMQFGHLVPDMSVTENVALPLMLRGVSRGEATTSALAALDEVGLASEAARRPGELSGGQQQRAAVARALMGDPQVVFADEPTGSLDTVNGDLVMGLLTDRARAARAAVVVVTHDRSRLAGMDRVVSMRDGVQLDERHVLA